MMCNRSIELHQYKHVPKLKSRDSMLTLRMGWSGLPQIGISAREAIRKATVSRIDVSQCHDSLAFLNFPETAQSLMPSLGNVSLPHCPTKAVTRC